MRTASLTVIGKRVPRLVKTIVALLVVISALALLLTLWSRATAVPSTVLTSVRASPACPAPC
jgi:hypothetical protein